MEASIGSPCRSDRLGTVEHGDECELHVASRPPGNVAAFDSRAAVFAACLRPVGRGRGLAMAGEPVLASVHRRDVLAAEAAGQSVEPDALAQAAWRGRRRRAAGRDDRSGQTRKRHQDFEPEAGNRRYDGDGKAIAHPTDSRLLERCREHLVKAAAEQGLKLRQNYNREAPVWRARSGATRMPSSTSG